MKTLKEYLEVYLQKEKLKVKESSYALYSDYVNNKIIPYFKDTTLEQLNNDLIQDFVIHLATVGNSRTNEGLSHSTTNEILNLLIRSIKNCLIHLSTLNKYILFFTFPNVDFLRYLIFSIHLLHTSIFLLIYNLGLYNSQELFVLYYQNFPLSYYQVLYTFLITKLFSLLYQINHY